MHHIHVWTTHFAVKNIVRHNQSQYVKLYSIFHINGIDTSTDDILPAFNVDWRIENRVTWKCLNTYNFLMRFNIFIYRCVKRNAYTCTLISSSNNKALKIKKFCKIVKNIRDNIELESICFCVLILHMAEGTLAANVSAVHKLLTFSFCIIHTWAVYRAIPEHKQKNKSAKFSE